MPEHRGIHYEVIKAESQWVWAIASTQELALRPRPPMRYSTRREAEAACRAAIDRALDPPPYRLVHRR